MKVLKLLISLGLVIAVRCSCGGDVAGNGDVVSTGSIFGSLTSKEGDTIEDTVTVALYRITDTADALSKKAENTPEPFATQICSDGSYGFDSLAAGLYSVEVMRDEIVVGEKDNIVLEHDEAKEVNLTVVIIINQTFNITTVNNNQNITINNIHMDNGVIEEQDSGYVLTTAENDTLIFMMDIIQDEDTSTVTARIIRNEDGSAEIEIIETGNEDEEIEVIITPGTGPAVGYLGEIIIDIKEPGTIKVESEFDTSDVPMKSRQ